MFKGDGLFSKIIKPTNKDVTLFNSFVRPVGNINVVEIG